MSCFSAGPPDPGSVCIGMALLTGLSVSLMAMVAALAASLNTYIISCVTFCSSAIFL